MSILSKLFTDFPEFIDYRQDQMFEIMNALRTIKNISADDPNEILDVIRGIDPQRLFQMYANRNNEMRSGNRTLTRNIRNVTFRPFKAVIGDDDYV